MLYLDVKFHSASVSLQKKVVAFYSFQVNKQKLPFLEKSIFIHFSLQLVLILSIFGIFQ